MSAATQHLSIALQTLNPKGDAFEGSCSIVDISPTRSNQEECVLNCKSNEDNPNDRNNTNNKGHNEVEDNVKDDDINDIHVDGDYSDADPIKAAFGNGDSDRTNVSSHVLPFSDCTFWRNKYCKFLSEDFTRFGRSFIQVCIPNKACNDSSW